MGIVIAENGTLNDREGNGSMYLTGTSCEVRTDGLSSKSYPVEGYFIWEAFFELFYRTLL
jgi:hypothetical protein